jgi:hypothetical protein
MNPVKSTTVSPLQAQSSITLFHTVHNSKEQVFSGDQEATRGCTYMGKGMGAWQQVTFCMLGPWEAHGRHVG